MSQNNDQNGSGKNRGSKKRKSEDDPSQESTSPSSDGARSRTPNSSPTKPQSKNGGEGPNSFGLSPESGATPHGTKTAEMFYSMKGTKQGIIIINQKFPDEEDYRYGAEKDVMNLKEIYDKLNIDYSPKEWCEDKENVWHDLEEHEMHKRVKTFSENIKKPCSAIFVSISSHGKDNGEIMGSEGRYVRLSELIQCFQTEELLRIPKIFIIQACKGEDLAKCESGGDRIKTVTPIIAEYCTRQADILIAYSTSEGFKSIRDSENGSWFIEMLHKSLLDARYDSWHFVEILTLCTNQIVGDYSIKESNQLFTQTPSFYSTLRKFLRFSVNT